MHPLNPLPALFAHRYLLGQLIRREVLARYKGSALGVGWSFLHPLLLLFAFTLVFGGVFGGRWGSGDGGKTGFEMALFIYCGLAVFVPFSEVIGGAPKLLLANQHFVRKVVFPLEILPVAGLIAASIHGTAHLLLLAAVAMLSGHATAHAVLIPVILIPAWLVTLGLAWGLAAAGAYVRDIGHGMPVLTQLLMFGLPVFYPNVAAPGILRTLNTYNPIAVAMEDLRCALLTGGGPDWTVWTLMLGISAGCALLGYALFSHCREEFADVL
jgi:lipopolysaccharide transport system permease protein